MQSSRNERKKKSTWCRKGETHSLAPSSHSGGMVCTADQCTMPPKVSSGTPSSMPQPFVEEKSFANAKITPFNKGNSSRTDDLHENFLLGYLPPDLHDAMQTAAKNSFLPAFLSSLTQEFLTDYLKPRHYSASQIYYIHQAVRALLVISAGATVGRTLASTSIALLSKKCLGDKYSSYASSAAMLAYDFYLDPANFVKTGVTFASSFGSSWVVSSLTSYSLFKLKKAASSYHKHTPPKLSM